MELYKPSPTLGEATKRSGRSGGRGCPKLHCYERQEKLEKGIGWETKSNTQWLKTRSPIIMPGR
jgi:hypothetical protein